VAQVGEDVLGNHAPILPVGETGDGYRVAEYPSLPGCVSRGKAKREAVANIREAISAYVAAPAAAPRLRADTMVCPYTKRDSHLRTLNSFVPLRPCGESDATTTSVALPGFVLRNLRNLRMDSLGVQSNAYA